VSGRSRPGFVKIHADGAAALRAAGVSLGARWTLAELLLRTYRRTREFRGTLTALTKDTGIPDRSLRRYIEELEAAGVIEMVAAPNQNVDTIIRFPWWDVVTGSRVVTGSGSIRLAALATGPSPVRHRSGQSGRSVGTISETEVPEVPEVPERSKASETEAPSVPKTEPKTWDAWIPAEPWSVRQVFFLRRHLREQDEGQLFARRDAISADLRRVVNEKSLPVTYDVVRNAWRDVLAREAREQEAAYEREKAERSAGVSAVAKGLFGAGGSGDEDEWAKVEDERLRQRAALEAMEREATT
jgi:hypothetical protein